MAARLVTILILVAALPAVMASPLEGREPKPFARTAEVNRPIDQVFESLKNYFSPGNLHYFEVVEANKAAGVIKAKRTNIDQKTWEEWAYCKLGTLAMLDTLQDATATVKVVLEKDGRSRTHVSALPDFEGTFSSLTGATQTVQCQSLGVLEKDILSAAGASAEETGE